MAPKLDLRVAFGKHPRVRFYVETPERREALSALVEQVKAAKGVDYEWVVKTLEKAAGASDAQFEDYKRVIAELVAGDLRRKASAKLNSGDTFKTFSERWTSGELTRKWPDYVKAKKSKADDVNRFERLYKTIGDVPLSRFTLADAERAMGALDSELSSATRRQYAQLISKVLKLAVYPCKLIERSPLPVGFLPKVTTKKATAFLYPSEDAQLLACKKVPLGRRLLYGFLAREGLRFGEATSLRWRDFDLTRGVVTLDENKTDDPRAWALSPGVKEALAAFKRTNASPDALVFSIDEPKAAQTFRDDLRKAKIERPELFNETANRKQIRVHDLRATFVTLSLANGKTESWVADRTGHKSSAMINKYRRQARQAAELKLGELTPLARAIPELAPKGPKGGPGPGQKPGQKRPARARSRTPRVASRSKFAGDRPLRARSRTLARLSKSVSSNRVSVQPRPSAPAKKPRDGA